MSGVAGFPPLGKLGKIIALFFCLVDWLYRQLGYLNGSSSHSNSAAKNVYEIPIQSRGSKISNPPNTLPIIIISFRTRDRGTPYHFSIQYQILLLHLCSTTTVATDLHMQCEAPPNLAERCQNIGINAVPETDTMELEMNYASSRFDVLPPGW